MKTSLLVHGTAVAFDNIGVLLLGPPESGKSDLALRLIDQGWMLISDDQTIISRQETILLVSAPHPIRGLIEVRGLGIITCPFVSDIPLQLVFDLKQDEEIERLPNTESVYFLNLSRRCYRINARQASAVAKVRLALGLFCGKLQ